MIGGESTRQFRVDFVPFRSIPLAAQCVARRATLANNARLTVIDHHFGSWVAQESRWAVGQAVGAGIENRDEVVALQFGQRQLLGELVGWQLFAIGAIPGVWAGFLLGAGETMLGCCCQRWSLACP